MSIEQTKCKSCGANLERLEDNNFYCPHCKSTYVLTNDVNNTYITNNENIVKNFYGDVAVKSELDNEKISGYFIRAYDDYFSGEYSNAKDFVIRILTKQPNNEEAIILKEVINRYKGKNGRYASDNFKFSDLSYILNLWIDRMYYLNTSENFDKLLKGYLDKLSTFIYVRKDYSLSLPQCVDMMNILKNKITNCNNSKLDYITYLLDNAINEINGEISRQIQRQAEYDKQYKKDKIKHICIISLLIALLIVSLVVIVVMMSQSKGNPDLKGKYGVIGWVVLFTISIILVLYIKHIRNN